MKKQIAQKLFDWIKEPGPPLCGDAYDQERIDGVYDLLKGHPYIDVNLTPEETAFLQEHGSLVDDEIERLLTN